MRNLESVPGNTVPEYELSCQDGEGKQLLAVLDITDKAHPVLKVVEGAVGNVNNGLEEKADKQAIVTIDSSNDSTTSSNADFEQQAPAPGAENTPFAHGEIHSLHPSLDRAPRNSVIPHSHEAHTLGNGVVSSIGNTTTTSSEPENQEWDKHERQGARNKEDEQSEYVA